MSSVLDELVKLLALERLEENLFRGQSQDLGWGVVFGGQVLGQALTAAIRTVPLERSIHSLHAYFLRPGDVSAPIVYDVDRIRDGSSFTTRRVVAIQHGEVIFNLAASFHRQEPGFVHSEPMPNVPAPESLQDDLESFRQKAHTLPKRLSERILAERPFETRTVETEDALKPTVGPPMRHMWFRTAHALPDEPAIHQAMLAYESDFAFLATALKPHGVSWLTPGMQVASLDHALWIHAPLRVDGWLLHEMHSPKASSARGLVTGRVYTRDGQLVASTVQEGLMRLRET